MLKYIKLFKIVPLIGGEDIKPINRMYYKNKLIYGQMFNPLLFSGTAILTEGNSFIFNYVGIDGITYSETIQIDDNNYFEIELKAQPRELFESFKNQSKISTLIINNLDTSNVTTMENMFYQCYGLEHLEMLHCKTSNISNLSSMFMYCSKLSNCKLSFDTTAVVNASNMFSRCTSLIELDISSFNTPNLINANNFIYRCTNLISLDISNLDLSKVSSYYNVINTCNKLETIYMRKCNDNTINKINSIKPNNAIIIKE